MKNSTRKPNSETVSTVIDSDIASVSQEARDMLSEILRNGAQKMLQTAIHREVDDYLQERSNLLDEHGRRLVVRNGSLPERTATAVKGRLEIIFRIVKFRAADPCFWLFERLVLTFWGSVVTC